MSKENTYKNVTFKYIYTLETRKFVNDEGEEDYRSERHPVAVICFGKLNSEFAGKVGVSICGYRDQFSRKIGKAIAYHRIIANKPIPKIGQSITVKRRWRGEMRKFDTLNQTIYIVDNGIHDINDYIAKIVDKYMNEFEQMKSFADSFMAEMSK